jgi:uncharacterized membrane protein YbhN (UPF0104 family)
MQAGALLVIYVLTTIVVQLVGFFVSQLVSTQWPNAGLMTFLVLFMAAFGLAWPLAVAITEWGIRRAGYVLETEQSAGASHRGHYSRHREAA